MSNTSPQEMSDAQGLTLLLILANTQEVFQSFCTGVWATSVEKSLRQASGPLCHVPGEARPNELMASKPWKDTVHCWVGPEATLHGPGP